MSVYEDHSSQLHQASFLLRTQQVSAKHEVDV